MTFASLHVADWTPGTIFESGMITAVSAGTAGTVAAVVTTPIDVVSKSSAKMLCILVA